MRYKVTKGELPEVKSVLKRDDIPYEVHIVSETAEIEADITEERFAEVSVDAECEREMQLYAPRNIPVYSLETIKNPEKFLRLQAFYRKDEPGDFPRGRMPFAPMMRDRDEIYAWAYPDRPWTNPEILPLCGDLIIAMHRIYALEALCGPIEDRVVAANASGLGFIA